TNRKPSRGSAVGLSALSGRYRAPADELLGAESVPQSGALRAAAGEIREREKFVRGVGSRRRKPEPDEHRRKPQDRGQVPDDRDGPARTLKHDGASPGR